MDDSFEEALDSHLEVLCDQDAAAESEPQNVHQLDLAPLISTAKAIGRVPRPGLSPEATRRIEHRLLARARELSPSGERMPRSADSVTILHLPARAGTRRLPRLLGVAATILLALAILGGGSVLAATDSLPSSLLYPVKIAGEQAQLILAQSSAGRARARMLVAEHRLSEIEAIASSGSMVNERLVSALQEAINGALEEIERIAPQNSLSLLSRLNDIIDRQEAVLHALLLTVPADDRNEFEAAAAVAHRQQQASARALARALKEQPAPIATDATPAPTSASPTGDRTASPSSRSGRLPSDRWDESEDDREARPTPSGTSGSAGASQSRSTREPVRVAASDKDDDGSAEHLLSAGPTAAPATRAPTAATSGGAPTPGRRAKKEDSRSNALTAEQEHHDED